MRIDNTPLREAYLAGDRPLAHVADEAGMDREALRRSLGLTEHKRRDRHGSDKMYVYRQTRMAADTAMRLLAPLGLDPIDVGL